MKLLEERIIKDGKLINDRILKVDSFINHQIDTKLLLEVTKDLTEGLEGIDKILTIETSGIAFAIGAAINLNNIPVVFAKKSASSITDLSNVYTSKVYSFTRDIYSNITVNKDYLKEGENILIVDDFLADGNAALGLIEICKEAKANVKCVSVVIEKRFQKGRQRINELGIKVKAAASITKFENDKIFFFEEER